MFRGNAVVIILPLLLMGFIFYGGYHYLNSSDQISNEDLNNVVSFVVEVASSGNTHTISGQWDWQEMPTDGMAGDDYIGVKLVEEEQHLLEAEFIKSAHLILMHGGNEIFETEGTIVNDGVVFTFPNELQEHVGYGNVGSFKIVLVGEQFTGTEVSVSYLHTWEMHDRLSFNQARLSNMDIDMNYWLIERFTTIPD